NDMVMEAAQQFASAPEIDPGRFWASRTAGQKFAAVIAMGLLGASGNVAAAIGFLNNAIQADIDAQKANLAKMQTSYGMASEQFGREQNMYQQMRALAADEREADLMFTKARLQQAQMEMQAKLQRAGVQTLNAQQ